MAIYKRVILSAGHGGVDPGSSGQGKTEYSQNLDIVNRTVKLLKADGQVKVVVVPPELTLDPAISWVNARYKNIDDGVAVEVHKNDFSSPAAHGLETWYGTSATSKVLAGRLHSKLIKITGLRDRGIKTHTSAPQGGLGWIARTNTWALLPEMGFMDSDHHNNAVYARALFEGVLNLWGLKPKPVDTTDYKALYLAAKKDIAALKGDLEAKNNQIAVLQDDVVTLTNYNAELAEDLNAAMEELDLADEDIKALTKKLTECESNQEEWNWSNVFTWILDTIFRRK